MQDLKLSSNLFKQGGISAVEKITFISCESKNRSYINWNNSLEHIIIDLYSIPKDELTCNTTHDGDGSSGGLNGGVHHHILAITALYLDALDDGFHACVNLFSVSVRKKNCTVQMLVNYTWSSRNKIQWYKTRSKIFWTYPQTTGISCCLDVPCGSGPLEPLVTREKMTSSSKFPLSLKHFLKFWSNICRHGELNWDPCPCPCPCPGWPCWPWAAAPPIVIPVKHLKMNFICSLRWSSKILRLIPMFLPKLYNIIFSI